MTTIDWTVVIAYFVFSAAVGLYYAKRAGTDTSEFFLSGRNLPWWLAGTSMVATTFAADTPLAVTELVARHGVAGNWLWWNFLFGGMLTVFFFARLWRRAGIMTDVEFAELRYSGKPAAFLRGFRALYLGLFINCVIMAWVNLAMGSILEGMFGIPRASVYYFVAAALALTAIYSAMSGLWGVAVTDLVQFAIAMSGTVAVAVVVLRLPQVGGIGGLQHKLPDWAFRFAPVIGAEGAPGPGGALAISLTAFLAYVGIQWWASWYPGAEPGGGGFVAQRMMSSKDERQSVLATLWFQIAHYCVRPWPWILTGLATLVLYPELSPDQKRLGYIYAMRDYLPTGLRGMLVAAFFAAYMSTVSTQLNWGSSYVINDFYRRFVRRDANEKHLVRVARISTLLIMALSLVITGYIDRISGAWEFIIECGAGVGLVLILRWFWWRISAWSEIAAMIAPVLAYSYIRLRTHITFPESLYYICLFATLSWLLVTFVTPPTDIETLKRFYRRVHPGGILWKPIAVLMPEVKGTTGYGKMFLDWLAGIILVYAFLFGTGKVLFGFWGQGALLFGLGIAAGAYLWRDLGRITWRQADDEVT
jgi:solute:Na+ symporter, SSS family